MDYRLFHNYPGSGEIRLEAASDEEALGRAQAMLDKVVADTPEEKRWDLRGRLVRVVKLW